MRRSDDSPRAPRHRRPLHADWPNARHPRAGGDRSESFTCGLGHAFVDARHDAGQREEIPSGLGRIARDWFSRRIAMLILTRKKNEVIRISDDISIRIVEIRGDKVRVGIW